MSRLVEHRVIKHAKKEHQCSWCSTSIEVKESYVRQRVVDGYDTGVVRYHPECYEAFTFLPHHYQEESVFDDYQRGCCCLKTQKRDGCYDDCEVAQAGGLKKHGQCFNCHKWVGEMDYCFGCKHWICDKCEVSHGQNGGHGHDPSSHLTEPPDECS